MRGIQFILITGCLVSFITYLTYFRSSLRDRMVGVVLFFLSVITVAAPETAQIIADLVGVGRGADLAFYIFGVTASFCLVLLYLKIHQMEQRNTELVRSIAIIGAIRPEERGK